MSNFGFLIVRRPAPDTEVEDGGLLGPGHPAEDVYTTAQAAWDAARSTAAPGDLVHILAIWGPEDEPQLCSHISPDEVEEDTPA
jgi:hypothetical protein